MSRKAKIIPLSAAAAVYIPLAKHYLRKALDSGRVPFKRVYAVESSSFIKVSVTEFVAKALIYVSGAFVANPRSSQFRTTEPLFPLIDDDGHTYLIDSTTGKGDPTELENYGNISTGGEDPLSWRGPTGRLIANDLTKDIPGLMTLDDMIGVKQFYTPFGENVYSEGDKLQTLTGLRVLCAGYVNGELRVAVQQSGNFTNSLKAWRGDAWTTLATWSSSRASTPCDMLANGDAVFQDGLLSNGAFTPYVHTSSVRTADGMNWNRSGLVDDKVLRAVVGGVLTEYVGEYSILDQTMDTKTGSKTTATAQLYVPPYTITVSGPFDIVTGSQYTQSGGLGGGTWTISSGSIDASTGIVTNPGCGTVTVTYTETICGTISGSKKCKAASGHWVTGSTYLTWPYRTFYGSTSCGEPHTDWPLGTSYQGAPFPQPSPLSGPPSGATEYWAYASNYGCYGPPCGDYPSGTYINNSNKPPGVLSWDCYQYVKATWECPP